MSWEDIMQRVLSPARGVSPHTTSAYGATNRPPGSTNPHRGVDINYAVGPNGQRGINLQHPALRAPVDGVVENAGEGTAGRIAIRDANGFLHGILHTHTRYVAVGDRVVVGQLIGTMGNTGTRHLLTRGPAAIDSIRPPGVSGIARSIAKPRCRRSRFTRALQAAGGDFDNETRYISNCSQISRRTLSRLSSPGHLDQLSGRSGTG